MTGGNLRHLMGVKIGRRMFLRALGLCLPAAAAPYSFWCEPGWLKVRHLSLSESPQFKVVHFTDLHHKGDRVYLERVVQAINRTEPDLVCFTGDLIEESEFLPETLELLQAVKAPLIGVPGNHDYWANADFEQIRRAFRKTGGDWLMDEEAIACGGELRVVGFTCSKPDAFDRKPGVTTLALIHYPSWVEHLEPGRYDLALAGHSHGGQVRLPLVGALLVPFGVGDLEMGLYQTAAGPLYVNPGIGCFFLNIRFYCRPEITVFHLS
jgi:uncharacterized protein